MGAFNIESMKKLVRRTKMEAELAGIDTELTDEEYEAEKERVRNKYSEEEQTSPVEEEKEEVKEVDFSTICYDAETTGIDTEKDEIIRLSVIDRHGNILFNSYIRPTKHDSWDDAERVHGISSEMLIYAPTKEDVMHSVKAIFDRADNIITFNGSVFDNAMLKQWGIDLSNRNNIDVMREYSDFKKVPNDTGRSQKPNCYKWFTLSEVAESYGISCRSGDLMERLKITSECYKKLTEEKSSVKSDK